jgi:hypothetical protein
MFTFNIQCITITTLTLFNYVNRRVMEKSVYDILETGDYDISEKLLKIKLLLQSVNEIVDDILKTLVTRF